MPSTPSPPLRAPPLPRASSPERGLRRGLGAGGAALLLLVLAAGPARVAGAQRVTGGLAAQALWTVAGLLRDLAAVILLIAPAVLLLAVVVPLASTRIRRARWQRGGAMLVAVPFALVVWVFGITAQEFKAERGSYPTVFDLAEGASSATFVQGTLGFLRYDSYWIPALVFGLAGAGFIVLCTRRRRPNDALSWRRWSYGLGLSLALGALLLRLFVAGTAAGHGRFSASVVGDPFGAIAESSLDLMAHRGRTTPRDLVRDAALPDAFIGQGASLLGWPPPRPLLPGAPCVAHPYFRPLDRNEEPPVPDARGEELVRALERVSALLFSSEERDVVLWQLTLESFRGDDIHALNPLAPRETAPFVNGLYEAAARGEPGVLASRSTYQAGVRTAQGVGALTCGLGTLPYNLSVVRDLQPFAMRCLPDVLTDAGFRGSFFYGSDAKFDGMEGFFRAHGYVEQITQAELSTALPTGAWGAVTDLALVEEAVSRVASSDLPPGSPRFVMLMSMSNHSPYSAPADLPPEVAARVEHGLATTRHHAVDDDRPRIVTHSYTDAAVARFFERLEERHLAERSIVVLAADHSTGEGYVWGPDTHEPDSDSAKARIPFAIVLPPSLLERAAPGPALAAALASAQRALDAAPLSQNDIPALTLALLRHHGSVSAMPREVRWHTLGGQITSPWFHPMARPGAYVFGVNGVSQVFALDRAGARVGAYEESLFLKTRSDRYSVTPSLVPMTATLSSVMRAPPSPCGAEPSGR